MRGPPSGFGLFCHKTYTRTKGLLLLFTQNILRYQVELDGIVKTALFAQKEWIVDEYGYEAEAELWLVPYTGEWKAVVKFYAPEEDFGWQMVLECVLLDE